MDDVQFKLNYFILQEKKIEKAKSLKVCSLKFKASEFYSPERVIFFFIFFKNKKNINMTLN